MCLALHSGGVATEGALDWALESLWPMNHILRSYFYLESPTLEKTAETVLMTGVALVVRKEREKSEGAYLVPIGKTSKTAANPIAQKDLWELTERTLTEEEL